ncbi:MAG: carboxypeptidase regulatory-like domain-containing protein [Vicinamibacterales bacterium]
MKARKEATLSSRQDGREAGPCSAVVALLILTLSAVSVLAQGPTTGGTIRGRVAVPDVAPSAGRPLVADLGGGTHPPIDRRRVVVYLESAPQQAFSDIRPGRARMDQRGQQFVPHVLAVTAGTVVDFPNNDKTFHNVFSLSRVRTFDLGRFAPGRTGSVRFDRPGIVPIFCDIHSHMSAYVLVFGHNYFALSDDNGRYTIENVPAGNYSLAVWSELGTAPARRVSVLDGAVVEADFRVSREP